MFEMRDVGWAATVLHAGCPSLSGHPLAGTGGCPGAPGCPVAELLHDLGADDPGPAGLAVLASVDRARLSGPELVLLLAALGRAQSWLTWVTEATLLSVDTRAQVCADEVTTGLRARGVAIGRGAELPDAGREEIALALRISPLSAQHRLGQARSLRDETRHPGLADQVRRGLTSPAHARALVLALEGEPDDLCAQIHAHPRVQHRLLTGVPWQVATTAVSVAAHLRDPVAAEEAHRTARERRRITHSPLPDGMAEVVATVPAEDAAALMARLQESVARAKAAGDPRTADQIRADTLTALGWLGAPPVACTGGALPATKAPSPSPPSPRATDPHTLSPDAVGPDPTVLDAAAWDGRVCANLQVTISIDTLLELAEEPARLGSASSGTGGTEHGWITSDTARALLARPGTTWQRFAHDTSGLLLGVTRSHAIPADLARLAAQRYTRCTFPGCHRRHGSSGRRSRPRSCGALDAGA